MSKVEADYARRNESTAFEQVEVEAAELRAMRTEYLAGKLKSVDSEISSAEIATLKEHLEVVNSEYEAQAA
eukprot:3378621-Karenia_brevis.AAC.1